MSFWVLFLRQEKYLACRCENRQPFRLNSCRSKRERRSGNAPTPALPLAGEGVNGRCENRQTFWQKQLLNETKGTERSGNAPTQPPTELASFSRQVRQL